MSLIGAVEKSFGALKLKEPPNLGTHNQNTIVHTVVGEIRVPNNLYKILHRSCSIFFPNGIGW